MQAPKNTRKPRRKSIYRQRKRTARELVMNRLKRVQRIENDRPGAIRQTAMLFAFIRAV